MKKHSLLIILSLIVCMCCAAALFAACGGPTLPTPTGLHIEEDTQTVVWDEVENARTYQIEINGQVTEVRRTSYTISQMAADTYNIRVMAMSDSEELGNSDWSQPLVYEKLPESGLSYSLNADKTAYEVVGIGSASGNVTVDSVFRGKPVVAIHANAFENNNRLTSLTIPEGVTEIGARAFQNCSFLTSISLPQSLTKIGDCAFQSCRALTSIEIPAQITELASHLFSYCRGLTTVTFGGDNVEVMQDYVFADCSSLTGIKIPSKVVAISEFCFTGCAQLSSVEFGSNVTSIEDCAFYRCSALTQISLEDIPLVTIGQSAFRESGLTSIVIPDTVVSIGASAFRNCAALTNVSLGSGLQKLGSSAFYDTPYYQGEGLMYVDGWIIGVNAGVTEVTVREDTVGIADYSLVGAQIPIFNIPDGVKYIGEYAFATSTLVTLTIGSGVETIGSGAFYGCATLQNVIFAPDSKLADIGTNAFRSCTQLAEIELPSSVKRIRTYAFYDTALWINAPDVVYAGNWAVGWNQDPQFLSSVSLKSGTVGISDYAFYRAGIFSLSLPETVKIIGYGACYQAANCSAVNIPEGVEEIADYAFYGCTQLRRVQFPQQSLTSIGRSAFYKCSYLSAVSIPDSVTSIGPYAFYKCVSLTELNLGNGLQQIGERAFLGCERLTTLTLPNSLKQIDPYAFRNCIALQTVQFGNGLVSIGNYAFSKCAELTSVSLPDTVTDIGNYAFYKCEKLTQLNLGSGIKNIGNYAFYSCTSLNGVFLPQSVINIGNYAFRKCALTCVILGGNVQYIGAHAFNGNDNLTIYAATQGASEDWHTSWNSSFRPVVWGCEIVDGYVVSITVDNISNSNARNGFSAPARQGYSFGGWSLTQGGQKEYEASALSDVPEGTKLYAIWVKESPAEGE